MQSAVAPGKSLAVSFSIVTIVTIEMMRHPAAARPPSRRTVGLVASISGALLVAGSGLATWVDAFGTRLSGFRMAELIEGYGSRVEGVPPRWVGVAWYLFPIAAGVCWTLTFLRTPPAPRSIHTIVGAVVSVASGVFLAGVGTRPGPLIALLGGLMIMVGGIVAASHGGPAPVPPQPGAHAKQATAGHAK